MWVEILILGLILLYMIFPKRPKNYPPGPYRLPIVGNLHLLGKNPLATLSSWKETYGNIIGLRFGDYNVVVLNGYELIKEAYDKPEFSGRPGLAPIVVVAGKEKRGLVASEGQQWSEQRRFALRNLRDFGFGKRSMESEIHEDVVEFIATLKKTEGTPITTDRMLSLVVLSSLWKIVSGEKIGIDDPKTSELLDTLNGIISSTSISGPAFFMSWIPKIAPKLTGWSKFETAVLSIKSFMRGIIKEHKETHQPKNPRDYLDVYLDEMQATTDPNSSFHGKAGEENMLVGMMNLFGAGAETTSSTLNWSFYFLAKDQAVQKKLQEELDTVVGKNRLPSLEDKDKLVYTEAVMQEVFRKSTLVPFGVFHSVMETVSFHGYEIPKNTAVMINLFDVHHDSKVWGDPENFRPERFLSKDGKSIIKAGPVIPFSIGKRACLGETLARANFFLALTAVMQRFQISFDPDTEINSVPSLFRFPPKNKLIFKDRYN